MGNYHIVNGVKREKLNHIKSMSGTGWQDEDSIECPVCVDEIVIPDGKKTVTCSSCKTKYKVEYGYIPLVRFIEKVKEK